MTNTKQAAFEAGTNSNYSWLQLLNPLSAFTDGGDRYPAFMNSIFKNKDTAHLVSKVVACGLLAAGLTAAYKAGKYVYDTTGKEDLTDPSRKARKAMDNTFEPTLGKSASDVDPSNYSAIGTMRSALPIAAVLLASAAAYNASDSFFDKLINKRLSKSIDKKSDMMNKLIQARAMLAKGTADPEQIKELLDQTADDYKGHKIKGDRELAMKAIDTFADPDALNKTAGKSIIEFIGDALATAGKTTFDAVEKAPLAVGILAAALFGTAASGGYYYFKANDPNNIKYRAVKKGLTEYARSVADSSNLRILPKDADTYFKKIDGDTPKTDYVREAPELSELSNKPISITL